MEFRLPLLHEQANVAVCVSGSVQLGIQQDEDSRPLLDGSDSQRVDSETSYTQQCPPARSLTAWRFAAATRF